MNVASLVHLWNMTQQHRGTSGSRAAAGILLGLYNAERFPFDLTDLRVFDPSNLQHALQVISADAARCQMEVHAWLNKLSGRDDFGERFEHLAHEYGCFKRGRCKRAELRDVSPARITLRMPEQEADPKPPSAPVGVVERLRALLPELEHSRETHVEWRDCDQKYRDQNPKIGDAAFHAKCVIDYDERIACIHAAIAALSAPVGVEAPPEDCSATEWLDFVNGNSVEDVAQALAQQQGGGHD